jgi:hypothetical protein
MKEFLRKKKTNVWNHYDELDKKANYGDLFLLGENPPYFRIGKLYRIYEDAVGKQRIRFVSPPTGYSRCYYSPKNNKLYWIKENENPPEKR